MKLDHLAKPLSSYEQWMIGQMYKKHIQLVRYFGHKCLNKYPYVNEQDVYSCIDIAFVKAARTWNQEKGTFSTILGHFVNGEIRHFIRSNAHWGYSVPRRVRELGRRARTLLDNRKVPLSILHGVLGCSKEELREAMLATLSVGQLGPTDDSSFAPRDGQMRASALDLLDEFEGDDIFDLVG